MNDGINAQESGMPGCARVRVSDVGATAITRCYGLETVEPRRVVHQDLISDHRIGRPYRKLIEQTPVIDL